MSSVKKFRRVGAQEGETDTAKTHYLLESAFQLTVADSVVWYEQLKDLFEDERAAAEVNAARRARFTVDYMKAAAMKVGDAYLYSPLGEPLPQPQPSCGSGREWLQYIYSGVERLSAVSRAKALIGAGPLQLAGDGLPEGDASQMRAAIGAVDSMSERVVRGRLLREGGLRNVLAAASPIPKARTAYRACLSARLEAAGGAGGSGSDLGAGSEPIETARCEGVCGNMVPTSTRMEAVGVSPSLLACASCITLFDAFAVKPLGEGGAGHAVVPSPKGAGRYASLFKLWAGRKSSPVVQCACCALPAAVAGLCAAHVAAVAPFVESVSLASTLSFGRFTTWNAEVSVHADGARALAALKASLASTSSDRSLPSSASGAPSGGPPAPAPAPAVPRVQQVAPPRPAVPRPRVQAPVPRPPVRRARGRG